MYVFTSPLHDYKIKNISTFFKNVTTFFFFNISSHFRQHFTKCCNMFWDQHFFNQQMLVSSTIAFCKMLQHFLEMLEHFFYLHHLRCQPAVTSRCVGPRRRSHGVGGRELEPWAGFTKPLGTGPFTVVTGVTGPAR
jgi:hypothetical protein